MTADHNLILGRDLPFLHSFDPFYPQAILITRGRHVPHNDDAGLHHADA
ncbi:hypothetical protein [Candidatus Symbiopectobacterium sp. 'North America']|nr:hypothetical protein [Candidatus Symbiopectobacterium sp. 'North America']